MDWCDKLIYGFDTYIIAWLLLTTKTAGIFIHKDQSDVLKGCFCFWIYSPRHKLGKTLSRSSFSYLSGNFSSCATCLLIINIINNTTKNTKFAETSKNVTVSCAVSWYCSLPFCLLLMSNWYFDSNGSLTYKQILSRSGCWCFIKFSNAFVLPDPRPPMIKILWRWSEI